MRLIYFCALLTSVFAVQLPSYFPKCNRDDKNISECILKAAEDLRPKVRNGIEEIQFPSLVPYTFPNFYINHTKGKDFFEGRLKGLKFFGFDTYQISNLQFYPEDIMLRGKLHFDNLPSSSRYVLDGKMYGKPISGDGKFSQILTNVNINFIIIGNFDNKNDIQYCKLQDVNLRLSIERGFMNFTGMKQERGSLGDTNELIRMNPQKVAEVLAPIYQEIFRKYVTEYLEWFLDLYPYSELFPIP